MNDLSVKVEISRIMSTGLRPSSEPAATTPRRRRASGVETVKSLRMIEAMKINREIAAKTFPASPSGSTAER